MNNCKNCPYIKEECEKRSEWYDEDEISANVSGCYCDKLGCKIGWYGQCNEADDDVIDIPVISKGSRKHNKRERRRKYQNRLKRLSKYCYTIYYKDRRYIRGHGYEDLDKPYYERTYYGEHSKKYYKKLSNKLVRHYKGGIANGNNYRKIFDYAWSID